MLDATAAANTNSVVALSTDTLLDILPFFFVGLRGVSAGSCVRPRLEGSLKEREVGVGEGGGGGEMSGEAIVPAETMGAARRHAALRT